MRDAFEPGNFITELVPRAAATQIIVIVAIVSKYGFIFTYSIYSLNCTHANRIFGSWKLFNHSIRCVLSRVTRV